MDSSAAFFYLIKSRTFPFFHSWYHAFWGCPKNQNIPRIKEPRPGSCFYLNSVHLDLQHFANHQFPTIYRPYFHSFAHTWAALSEFLNDLRIYRHFISRLKVRSNRVNHSPPLRAQRKTFFDNRDGEREKGRSRSPPHV